MRFLFGLFFVSFLLTFVVVVGGGGGCVCLCMCVYDLGGVGGREII